MSHELLPDPLDLNQLALASMALADDEEMVAHRFDGSLEVFRFVETGETRLRTILVGSGEQSMSFEVPVKEPLLQATYDSLVEYVGQLPPKASPYNYDKKLLEATISHDTAYDGLRDTLLEDARQKSAEMDQDKEQLEQCSNCKGEPRTVSCLCMEGGSSYTDLEGDTVLLRAKGEADPDCSRCCGNGSYSPTCPTCKGNGEVIVNPLVTLINNETGVKAGFRFDLAKLIADGEVELAVYKSTQPNARARQANQVMVAVDFHPLLAKKAAEIGIDIYQDDFNVFWGPQSLELWATTFGHLLKPIEVPLPTSDDITPEETTSILAELQRYAWKDLRSDVYGIDISTATPEEVQRHAASFDLALDERLLIKECGMRLGVMMPAFDAMQELITTLAQYNYRLGFTYTGIATGEIGPALFILDPAGNVLAEIESGYEQKYVLENARRSIRNLHESGRLVLFQDKRDDPDML